MSAVGRFASPVEVVDDALARARSSACVVLVEEHSDVDVRFANNTTTTNGRRRDRSVTVITFEERPEGIAVGVASAGGSDPVADIVRAAERDVAQVPVAEDASELIASGDDDAQYYEPAPSTDLSVLRDVLDALPDAFARARSDNITLAGFAKHSVTTTYLGTSTGLRRRFVQPDGTVEVVARESNGAASSWVGVGTTDFSDVTFDTHITRALQRLSWAKRSIDLAPGRYEVLLPPDAVADLLVPFAEAMNGRDAEEGQSVFSAGKGTRIGESLSPAPFRLESDPHHPGLECAPFLVTHGSSSDMSVFDNGAPIDAVRWLDEGRLTRLRYHRAGAKRSGVPFTPAADNLIVSVPGATSSLEELIGNSERALLLTCLWYIREVDPTTLMLTGLTRDGVYLVEGGEVIGAVNNFRFNESPLDVLANATEVGATERALSREWNEWMSRTAMPAMRVAEFNMSSVSPAV